MMKKIIIISIIALFLIGIVVAQAINFPSSFKMILNKLPIKQSNTQLIMGCPYDENIEHRETVVRSYNPTSRFVEAEIRYWTNNRTCAGSWRVNGTLADSRNQQELITNFINEINSKILIEANANKQARNNTGNIISRGGN